MRAGQAVYIRASYLRTGDTERVDGEPIDTVLVRLNGHREPIRVLASNVEPAGRSRIRTTDVDWSLDRSRFSKSVRRLRQSKNISQKDIADMVGVTQATVSKWESGAMVPTMDRVASLAAVLGVSVSEIVEVSSGSRP